MMKPLHTLRCAIVIFWIAVYGSFVSGQMPDSALPVPRLFSLFPSGAKQGTTTEVTFAGADLEDPESIHLSHPGLKGELIIPPTPPVDPKQPAPKQPPAKPPINKFKVTVANEVPPGIYDVRVVNRWGVSNPRAFVVGELPEVLEKEPNNDIEQAQRIPLNSTVNGNLVNGQDVDYYVFTGKKGDRVVLSVLASSIDSKFHPEIQLYSKEGKRLASGRDYLDRDAVCDAVLPADGDYYIRLFEFTHATGGTEHFYRLTASTGPWIDVIYPPMIEPGKSVSVIFWGRNLPGGKPDPNAQYQGSTLERLETTVTAPSDPQSRSRLNYSGRIPPRSGSLDGFEYRLKGTQGHSNPVLFTYATAPVVVDNEKPRTAATAQPITIPCEIAGRVERRGDRDWYLFQAKKGEVWQIELTSERIGSPTPMFFVLRKASTSTDLHESVDNPNSGHLKFFQRSDDPQPYRFQVPEDGQYQLLVASRLADVVFGPRHVYRVRITPEHPDYQLHALAFANTRPDGNVIRPGGEQGITVVATRSDGFNGEISLTVEGLPKGVTCPPQTLGAGLRETTLILTAAGDAPSTLSEIRIKGTAMIQGQTVVREARPAGIVWPLANPANANPTISRVERNLLLAVRGKAPFHMVANLDKPVMIHGEKVNLTLKLTRLWPDFKQPLQVQIIEIPPNLVLANNPATIAPDKGDAGMTLQAPATVQPGVYNLVVRASAQIPFNKDPAAKDKPAVNVVQPVFPATLTIAPTTLGTLTLGNNNPMVKPGGQTELVVKVARQFGYTGEFKVEVTVPPTVKGISLNPLVISAGKEEARLSIKAAADAMPGTLSGMMIKASAPWNGSIPTTTPAVPFSVTVIK